MMEISFHPYQGLGDIKFGMNAEEICRILRISSLDDSFDQGFIFFGINENERYCSLIEVVTPLKISFAGMDLLQTSIGEIRQWLLENDQKAILSSSSMLSLKYGCDIYTESLLTDTTVYPESITFFQEGFYNDEDIADFLNDQERFLELEHEKNNS